MSAPSQVQLQIATTSQVMYFNNLPKPNPPRITMNGVAIPSPAVPPQNPAGWQVVIIDQTKDITNPASIITNQYISLFASNNNSWWNTYQYLYSSMLWNQLNSGNIQQQLIFLASFGLDNNMPPTNDAYNMMMDIGAGSQLQSWQTHCDIGSQVGNPTSWISFPANYILVGYVANSYAQGSEIYQTGAGPLTTTLNATLYNNV